MKKILCILMSILVIFCSTLNVSAEESETWTLTKYYKYCCEKFVEQLYKDNIITKDDSVFIFHNSYTMSSIYCLVDIDGSSSTLYGDLYYINISDLKTANYSNYRAGAKRKAIQSGYWEYTDSFETNNEEKFYFCNVDTSKTTKNIDFLYKDVDDYYFSSSSSNNTIVVNETDMTSTNKILNNIFCVIVFAIIYCYFLNPTVKILRFKKGDR